MKRESKFRGRPLWQVFLEQDEQREQAHLARKDGELAERLAADRPRIEEEPRRALPGGREEVGAGARNTNGR